MDTCLGSYVPSRKAMRRGVNEMQLNKNILKNLDYTNSSKKKSKDASAHDRPEHDWTGHGKDFWLLLLFVLFGWSLWAGKEIRALKMESDVAMVTPVAIDSEESFYIYGEVPTSEEALKWIYLLHSYDDAELSDAELLKKYQSLGMASAILSASSAGTIRQKFWSAQAVEYGEHTLSILTKSEYMLPAQEFNEANTRLLLAMALNCLQHGEVSPEEVADQFQNIDHDYLKKHGFYRNKLLRSLAAQNIIDLPNYFSDISI